MCSFSHTFDVQYKNQSRAHCCSFESSPYFKGKRWRVHKGYIMDRWGKTKAVVKVPSATSDNDRAQVFAEVDKYEFAKSVLRQCPDVAARVKLVPVYHSEIDKIGRGWKLVNRKIRKGNFYKGAEVVIQERMDDRIERLLEIGGKSQTLPLREDDQIPLLSLMHESYAHSKGECVITGMTGVKGRNRRGVTTYHLTSLTVHSLGKKFGDSDKGIAGVKAYKNWDCPPPKSFPKSQKNNNSRSVSSKVADDVFPEPTSQPSRVMPSAPSDPHDADRAQLIELLLNIDPSLRDLLYDEYCSQLLDPPPSYSFTVKNSPSQPSQSRGPRLENDPPPRVLSPEAHLRRLYGPPPSYSFV